MRVIVIKYLCKKTQKEAYKLFEGNLQTLFSDREKREKMDQILSENFKLRILIEKFENKVLMGTKKKESELRMEDYEKKIEDLTSEVQQEKQFCADLRHRIEDMAEEKKDLQQFCDELLHTIDQIKEEKKDLQREL